MAYYIKADNKGNRMAFTSLNKARAAARDSAYYGHYGITAFVKESLPASFGVSEHSKGIAIYSSLTGKKAVGYVLWTNHWVVAHKEYGAIHYAIKKDGSLHKN